MISVEIKSQTRKPTRFQIENIAWESTFSKKLSSEGFPENRNVWDKIIENSDIQSFQAFQRKLISAHTYCSQLDKIEISQDFLSHFQASQTPLDKLISKTGFRSWPTGVKWALESLLIICVIMIFAIIMPWDSFLKWNWLGRSGQVVLSEYKNNSQSSEQNSGESDGEATSVLYPDEPEQASEKDPTAPLLVTGKPSEQAPKSSGTQNPSAGKETPSATTSPGAEDTTAAKRTGFLYRGQIKVTNLDAITTKFIDKISEMGGRKAGDVPLGWRKGAGSYFHFTIPETKLASIKEFLGEYGSFTLSKEKHERVMPDGIARIIIQMEEK